MTGDGLMLEEAAGVAETAALDVGDDAAAPSGANCWSRDDMKTWLVEIVAVNSTVRLLVCVRKRIVQDRASVSAPLRM